jgi:hypothetical protein
VSKIATKKQLLESIKHLKAELGSERNIRYTAESKVRDLEKKLEFAQAHVGTLKDNVRDLERDLVDARARVEVYEFIVNLHFKTRKDLSSSDGLLKKAITPDQNATWAAEMNAGLRGR